MRTKKRKGSKFYVLILPTILVFVITVMFGVERQSKTIQTYAETKDYAEEIEIKKPLDKFSIEIEDMPGKVVEIDIVELEELSIIYTGSPEELPYHIYQSILSKTEIEKSIVIIYTDEFNNKNIKNYNKPQ